MVVVPTQNEVTLSYGRSPWDWVGLLATLIGLALVGWLMVLDHRRRRDGSAAVPVVDAESDSTQDPEPALVPVGATDATDVTGEEDAGPAEVVEPGDPPPEPR
jgi:hypothetical protein